jgi:hypothetical protein
MFGKCLPSFIIAGTQKSGTTALAGTVHISISSRLPTVLVFYGLYSTAACLFLPNYFILTSYLLFISVTVPCPHINICPQRLSVAIHKSAFQREKSCISLTAGSSMTKASLIIWILFAFGILPRTPLCSLTLQVTS